MAAANIVDDTIVKLKLECQNYAWGKPATTSKVAKLVHKDKSDGETPYAELWMGTHKNGASRITKDNVLLSEYLNGDLPYLFKVLSIARSLSIQVHPNKTKAEELHKDRPNVYKDDNHKPEMAVALTEFEAMCGFRPYYQICHFLENIKEFSLIVDDKISNDFIQTVKKSNEKNKNGNANEYENECKKMLEKLFTQIMKADKNNVKKAVESLIDRMTDKDNPFKIPNVNDQIDSNGDNDDNDIESKGDENTDNSNSNSLPFGRSIEINSLVLRLNKEFPNDVGIFAAFLFNCFRLKPNEGIFLKANLPHAYLSGDCFECMACSDNVVRAGLTPKLRDTNVLCQIVDYVAQEPPVLNGELISQHTLQYSPNVNEFRLMTTNLDKSQCETLKLKEIDNAMSDYASIILVTDGEGTINNVNVTQGDCLLVPNNIDTIVIESSKQCGISTGRCFTPKK